LQLEVEYKKSYAELKATTKKEYSTKVAEFEKEKLDFPVLCNGTPAPHIWFTQSITSLYSSACS
jgi:hypothetical protein